MKKIKMILSIVALLLASMAYPHAPSTIKVSLSRFKCGSLDRKILISIPEIIKEHPDQANFYSFSNWAGFKSCSEALKAVENYSPNGEVMGQLMTKTELIKERECVGSSQWTMVCYETGRILKQTDYELYFLYLDKMVLEKEIHEPS